MSTSGAQISIRCDAQELLMGMLPEGTENNLAYSSDENGMPNSVRTAQRPVVVMVAPEKQKKRRRDKSWERKGRAKAAEAKANLWGDKAKAEVGRTVKRERNEGRRKGTEAEGNADEEKPLLGPGNRQTFGKHSLNLEF